MNKNYCGFFILCFTVVSAASIKIYAEGIGSTAGIVLLEPVTAKSAAIAQAATAMNGDVLSLRYNPAGLMSVENAQFSVMYQKTISEDNFGSILYGRKVGVGALAVGVVYFDSGKIEMLNLSGDAIEKIGQRDIAATIGGGMPTPVDNLFLGAAIKFITSEVFGVKANAVAADLGVFYRGLLENTNFGVSAQNIGTKLKYIDESEKLPSTLRAGASYAYTYEEFKITGYADVPYNITEKQTLVLLGLEEVYNGIVALRAGYSFNLSDSNSDDAPISIGLGLMWGKFEFDYALGFADNLSMPQYLSVKIHI